MRTSPFDALDYDGWELARDPLASTVLEACLSVGEMLHEAFYARGEVRHKPDGSDLTVFDARSEEEARRIITAHEPGAAILGEETAGARGGWYIDGIDGTTNFSRGIPLCNFTLARVQSTSQGEEVIAGGVCDFVRGEIFYAVKGKGAFRNGVRIKVSGAPVNASTVCFAPLSVKDSQDRNHVRSVEALWGGMRRFTEASGRYHREFGCAALELAWVADGRLEGYASAWTNPWDSAAGAVLIEEAGGVVTDIAGNRWMAGYTGVVAGSKIVQPELLRALRGEE